MTEPKPTSDMLMELSGQMHAMRVCISALLASMPPEQQPAFAAKLAYLSEWATANVLGEAVPEAVNAAFAVELQTMRGIATAS